ncbi:Cytochrome P450 [Apodemus speciosus]|uniref:Cytochrome P450 n=1 Tax=Apodemus speciosus TaxID=105296 RepID=A0ABQ0FK73_APOSI
MRLPTGADLWPVAIFTVIFLLLVDLMHRRQRWAARYPPGPVPWPVLGNLPQMDFQNMPAGLQKMAQQLRCRFGDLFSLQLAFESVVVLNGLTVLREALVRYSEDTADRPPLHFNDQLGFGPRSQGVVLARYGPAWRQQRRFSVSTLRHFGLGKKSLEQWVTEEARSLCAAFADHSGCPFSPNTLLNKAVCNVIASLLYARRFEYDDPGFIRLLGLLKETLKEESGFLPMGLVDKVFPGKKAFVAMLDELLTEHRTTWDPAQPPRDLTDAFLAEIEKRMVTTSTTLSWALLLMILHPDVQRRAQQEIDEVIGQVRCPEMADQARLPYTNAVIHEVQRFGDILPLGVPHKTSRDIEVQGFLIPKGTTLVTNLSSVLKDETVWEKPLCFHPEHFLDAQGHFVKHEAFMPFSAGRRACLGEPLARMELFLFFTCLLQRFSFSVPDGQPRPSDHGVFEALTTPSPYQLCACPR